MKPIMHSHWCQREQVYYRMCYLNIECKCSYYKTYHAQRFHTEKQDNEEFIETYAEVFDIKDEFDDENMH